LIRRNSQGFTLVELAISISIIGLLLVGTLGGIDMIKAGRLRKVASEFTNYKTAIDQFVSEYQYLPGDLPTASSYWSGAHNGDGNTTITWSGLPAVREDLFAWEHLGKAGLITGSFTGAPNPLASGTVGYVLGTNAPKSEGIKNGIYMLQTGYFGGFGNLATYGVNGTAIRIGGLVGNSPYNGIVNAKDAYSIDKKIDDGKASSGLLVAIDNAATCVDALWTSSSANYRLTNTSADCQLLYWYQKF
jgi:prepilin-type N-terminal cleavage/methylation domain-containing protein